MRVVTLLLVCLVALWGCSALAQQTSTRDLLNRFSDAQAQGDDAASATLAQAILTRGFEGIELSPSEIRSIKVGLAESLAGQSELSEAIEQLSAVVSEEQRLARSAAGVLKSDVQGMLAAHSELLGDYQVQAARFPDAVRAYALALSTLEATVGTDEPNLRFVIEKLLDARQRSGEMPDPTLAARLERLRMIAEQPPLVSLGPSDSNEFETVRVFYASSRQDRTSSDPAKAYGRKRGPTSFGSVVVTVPKNRAVGAIPTPSPWNLSGAKDGVHIVVKRVDREPNYAGFRDKFAASVAGQPQGRREAFVYVHGFNQTFQQAAKRTAQLAIDLDMRGGAAFYSWPGGESPVDYKMAENNVKTSVAGLIHLLRAATESGADRVHIIAHSMGNRVLLEALDELERAGFAATRTPFEQVIFAAPDVDAQEFASEVPKVAKMAKGMTLYASSKDRALGVSSSLVDGYPRAGQAPPTAAVASAVVVVDTSKLARSTDLAEHDDYVGGAIYDVRGVTWLSLSPESRCILQKTETYWVAVDNRPGCATPSFRRAVGSIRLYAGPSAAIEQINGLIQTLAGPGDQNHPDLPSWREAKSIVERISRKF